MGQYIMRLAGKEKILEEFRKKKLFLCDCPFAQAKVLEIITLYGRNYDIMLKYNNLEYWEYLDQIKKEIGWNGYNISINDPNVYNDYDYLYEYTNQGYSIHRIYSYIN